MFNSRIQKLREKMKIKGIDGVFLVGDYNRNYLSGFTGDESFSVITLDKAVFITDSRFTEQARQQVKGYEIVQYNDKIEDFLAEIVKKFNVKKLGFEEDILTFGSYSKFNQRVQCEMVPLENIIEEIRVIKDKDEVDSIKMAAKIADEAFMRILQFIKPGMSEREVGAELEMWMKKLGASGLSFPSIVASGERSCLPHGQATDKVIQMGDFLTLDFGCVYNGYCSDMTRTIAMGNVTEEMEKIYKTVLEAQEKALAEFRPGVSGAEVDKIAREHIKQSGYGDYFGHGLGHGVGRQIHENPRISPKGDTILKPGMVVTDEPGIYIPNKFGVRIEDLILITDDGCEVLSKSPKELIYI